MIEGRNQGPTLSMQLASASTARIARGYVNDPVCDDYSVLITLDAAKEVRGHRASPRRRPD